MRVPRPTAVLALALVAIMAAGCGSNSAGTSSASPSASPRASLTATPTAPSKLPVARAGASSADASMNASTEPPGSDAPATPTPPQSPAVAKDFKIDAAPEYSGGTMDHLYLVKCNGVAGTWSGSNGFSFTLDSSGHGTMSNDFGDTVTITLVLDTASPYLEMEDPGIAIQKFPVTPGDFCNGDTPR